MKVLFLRTDTRCDWLVRVIDDFKQKLVVRYDLRELDLDSCSVEDVSKMILEVMQSSMSPSESDAFTNVPVTDDAKL